MSQNTHCVLSIHPSGAARAHNFYVGIFDINDKNNFTYMQRYIQKIIGIRRMPQYSSTRPLLDNNLSKVTYTQWVSNN